jgi:hypothetical protein
VRSPDAAISPRFAGFAGAGVVAGRPDNMRFGSGRMLPGFALGEWQSLHPETVTMYLPRATRSAWDEVDFDFEESAIKQREHETRTVKTQSLARAFMGASSR